jgi:hypothetical protein
MNGDEQRALPPQLELPQERRKGPSGASHGGASHRSAMPVVPTPAEPIVDCGRVPVDESELGPSELTGIVENWRTTLPDLEFRIVDLVADGDLVATRCPRIFYPIEDERLVELDACRTFRDTVRVMSDLISVRLDDEAQRALAELEATGLSRSEAVRRGLVAAALRLRDRQRLIDEVAELAADEADRAEAAEVAAMMEDLRAPG